MKTILATGASRGIGLEWTRQCLDRGHRLIATCREPERATALNALREAHRERLEVLPLDVEDESSVKILFAQLDQRSEAIDLLFNNAGIMDWDDFQSVSAAAVEKIYKVNLVGALLVLRAALPCLRRADSPVVANVSSRLGSIALRGDTQLGGAIAYQCSKAALNMLTKQASIDLAADGVTVVSQTPGWVRTDMGGSNAKYSVEESVENMLLQLEDIGPEANGKFLGEEGEEIPW
jgi:NAD(P)-dependent dehydrogenase (short-subunit alcohol dehydrogenase family)